MQELVTWVQSEVGVSSCLKSANSFNDLLVEGRQIEDVLRSPSCKLTWQGWEGIITTMQIPFETSRWLFTDACRIRACVYSTSSDTLFLYQTLCTVSYSTCWKFCSGVQLVIGFRRVNIRDKVQHWNANMVWRQQGLNTLKSHFVWDAKERLERSEVRIFSSCPSQWKCLFPEINCKLWQNTERERNVFPAWNTT